MAERRDVIRTKRSIENAYLELLFEKGDGRITVGNILERADISRGTFYAHYRDINDLADKVQESLIRQWREVVERTSIAQIIENPKGVVEDFLSIFESHQSSLRKILKNDGSLNMVRKFKHTIYHGVFAGAQSYSNREFDPGMLSLAGYCFTAMLVDTCICWICCDEDNITRENLVQYLSLMISGSVEKLSREDEAGRFRMYKEDAPDGTEDGRVGPEG